MTIQAYSTRTDVKFVSVGTGLPITRSCDARKGQWPCGAKVSNRGICGACEKARDARNDMKGQQ